MKTLSRLQLLLTFSLSLAVLIGIILANVFLEVEIPKMTRDLAQIAHVHPLYGILQNLGILLWCSTTAIVFFTAIVAYQKKQKIFFSFFLSASLLSAYLLVDDFFQLHELLVPFYLGINETAVLVVLGISVLAFLISFRKTILQTDYFFLLSALGFLASAVVIDFFQPWLMRLGPLRNLLEDSPKWLGIACWCSYFVQTSYRFIFMTPESSIAGTRRSHHRQTKRRR